MIEKCPNCDCRIRCGGDDCLRPCQGPEDRGALHFGDEEEQPLQHAWCRQCATHHHNKTYQGGWHSDPGADVRYGQQRQPDRSLFDVGFLQRERYDPPQIPIPTTLQYDPKFCFYLSDRGERRQFAQADYLGSLRQHPGQDQSLTSRCAEKNSWKLHDCGLRPAVASRIRAASAVSSVNQPSSVGSLRCSMAARIADSAGARSCALMPANALGGRAA